MLNKKLETLKIKKNTRGTQSERAERIGTTNKGIEVIQNKMAIRHVGRPRRSDAMSELEKQVSGQLLPI